MKKINHIIILLSVINMNTEFLKVTYMLSKNI